MLNVLLVEDDDVDAETVKRFVTCGHLQNGGDGVDVQHVYYFEKAKEILESEKPVDVVLLDLHLPDGNGIPLVETLCNTTGHAPVIVLTGINAPEELGVELVRAGAQDYLSKRDLHEILLARSIHYAIERNRMRIRIERQREELEHINEEMETFTYIASHDLRAPLVNLKGFSFDMHRSIDTVLPHIDHILAHSPEEEREMLRSELCLRMPKALACMATVAEKMDRMINALLKLSRLGRIDTGFEPIETWQIVEQCLGALAYQIEETRTTVKIGPLPGIHGNRDGIEHVFSNILDNALKYLDPARPGHISISGAADATHTVFCIEDNGRGIAGEDLHKVFEIFRRAGDVERIPGEGMGMAYVRTIVRRHQGDIHCESEPGVGTRFYFSIAHSTRLRKAM